LECGEYAVILDVDVPGTKLLVFKLFWRLQDRVRLLLNLREDSRLPEIIKVVLGGLWGIKLVIVRRIFKR
jgi:hypothetical protein